MTMKKRERKKNYTGLFLFFAQIAATIILIILLAVLNVLPTAILVLAVVLLLVANIITFLSQRYRNTRLIGKLFAIVVTVILLIGCIYLGKTWITLKRMTQDQQNGAITISVIVKQEDSAQTIAAARNYLFGIQKIVDRDNTNTALQQLKDTHGWSGDTDEYTSFKAQVEALYGGQVGAVLINETYRPLIEETFKDFRTNTRVIGTVTLEAKPSGNNSRPVQTEITEKPFVVFLSGIDTYGEIGTQSRSDVNILAAVNPKTKQILLLTTPRDYYVELARHEGAMDKLTHAGLYGIDISMETLENLYGISVDYYVRVNFTGFEKIIDALGGVEVYSEKAFSTDSGYSFREGMNSMDGKKALAFVRERYSFITGDIQRGRNQMALIQAVIDKALSSAILTNYVSLLDSIGDSFVSNIPASRLTALVKMQLSDNASWNIVTYNVSGTSAEDTTYSFGDEVLYVMLPDPETVAHAKELLRQVTEGEILSKE